MFVKIAKVEISFDLLGEMVVALDECWTNEEEVDTVLGVMTALPNTFRFELAVNFLGSKEKTAALNVLDRLLLVEALPRAALQALKTQFQ